MIKCDLCAHNSYETFLEKYNLNYVKCAQCGHVYADVSGFDYVSRNEETIKSLKDVHSAKYQSSRHAKAYAALLKEFAPYRQHNRLIEVGCASGAFLTAAVAAGWQAVGVEPVAESAQEGIRDHGLDIRIGVLEEARFDSDSADVIYSNAVIEHVDSPRQVFEEAFRILRRGGLFYADTVNIDSYTWAFLGKQWKLVDPSVHLHLFSPSSLRRLCESVGLEVVKMTTHGVRFHATREDRPTGYKRVLDELRKTPYSVAARRNLKGDNIAVYAVKS